MKVRCLRWKKLVFFGIAGQTFFNSSPNIQILHGHLGQRRAKSKRFGIVKKTLWRKEGQTS